MRPASLIAVAIPVAFAVTTLATPLSADAQSNCASANRVPGESVSNSDDVMSRRVSLHGRDVSLRDALDRLAAAARFRLSYSAEQLDLSKSVCLEYESAPVSSVLEGILTGVHVRPVVLDSDQIVLTPVVQQSSTEAPTLLKSVGILDRVVVTGSTVGASQRALPVALDVVSGQQLAERGAGSLSGALDGVVPGLWLWEQSPLSLLARYGTIRGASSFGVSYPKVYVDGIEVANSLLVTHLDPESVSRIEVIRGPQGAALYGADAISGVMNIVTRQDGGDNGAARTQLRSEGGASSSDYSANSVLAQSHAVSFRAGSNIKSARLGMTFSTIGPFIPGASSQQLTANGGARLVRSRGLVTGLFRIFAQDARTPANPVLAGLDLWPAASAAYRQAEMLRRSESYGPGSSGPDSAARHRLDSLSRLVAMDSSDRQSVRQFTVGATGSFTQSDRWTHSAVIGVDGYRLRSAAILDGAFPSALDSALRAATGSAMRTTLRASSVGQFGNPDRTAALVTLAAEHSFVRDVTVTRSPFAPGAMSPKPEPSQLVQSRTNAGLVGQVSASYREKLFLNGGIRIERNTGLSGLGEIATLPMFGASAIHSFPVGTLKVRAAYGKGIRQPQTSSRAGTLMGLSASVSPEQQSGVEAGVDFFIGTFASLHATRFDQTASGLIQPVSVYAVASEGDNMAHYRRIVYELQNVGEISNRGWELQGSLGNGPLSLGATFSQVDSRVRKLAARYTGDLQPGDRMLEVPARTFGINTAYNRGRLSMSWRISRASDWINYDRLSLLSTFASEKNDPRGFVGPKLRTFWQKYDGVTRIGGRMEIGVGRGMTFTLDGENLLNEQRGEPDNVTVLPGRTLSAGLRLRF